MTRVRMVPATTGPRTGAIKTGTAKVTCNARHMHPAARAIITCAIGASSPPLIPCRTRKPTRDGTDHASLHKAEETVKAPAPEIKLFGADPVYQPAVERQHKRQRQEVAAGHPLYRREPAVKLSSASVESDTLIIVASSKERSVGRAPRPT